MLGDAFLVAPVFSEEGEVQYYLPEGTWTNYLTGETAEGGCWRKEKHDYLSIPLWARENSIIPTGIRAERADYDFEDNLELKVYGLKDYAKTVVYQDNRELLRLEISKDGTDISVHADGAAGAAARFVNCRLSDVQGAQARIEGNDTVVTVEKNGTFTGTAS